jgi:hypothetical protein
MLIRFTRLTNDRHRFEIVRDDGSCEGPDLETRSTMLHDFVHFAVETEAGLHNSFYGRLAQGQAYDDLAGNPGRPEAMQTEAVVGQIQGSLKDGAAPETDPAQLAREIAAGFQSVGAQPPAWVTPEFIVGVRERLRRLQGQWRATPFHEPMEIEFPCLARRGRLL